MSFKFWLEHLDREAAKSIVLNALGADSRDPEEQRAILGSTLQQQPELSKKLATYAELEKHREAINHFLIQNKYAEVTQLIDFIAHLGTGPTTPVVNPFQDTETE